MESARGDWQTLVDHALGVSPYAAELSALSGPELEPLLAFLSGLDGPLPFLYVSVHAPTKDWDRSDGELVEELLQLPAEVESIILHPDCLNDLTAYSRLGDRLVIENMDVRYDIGTTPQDLAPLFDQLGEAAFCLDVAHVASIDPTMRIGHELLDAFGARLRQLHISSFSDEAKHVPLTDEDRERFEPLLRRCHGVPWILEAPLN